MQEHLPCRRFRGAPGDVRRRAKDLAVRRVAEVESFAAMAPAIGDGERADRDGECLLRSSARPWLSLAGQNAGDVVLEVHLDHARRTARGGQPDPNAAVVAGRHRRGRRSRVRGLSLPEFRRGLALLKYGWGLPLSPAGGGGRRWGLSRDRSEEHTSE